MYKIERPQDFIVEEITPDGTVLEVGKDWKFEGSTGEHLICVLEKINWDTNKAIKFISRQLHVSRKRIGFAGTKDKWAWTSQRISIWGIKEEDVQKIKLKDIQVKPLAYGDRINLGDLWGNRFTIKSKDMGLKTGELAENPPRDIPNYFGIQRFGEKRPVTHLVGKAIVKEDLEKAVKTYLAWIGPGERDETKEARAKLAEDWDWKKALSYFPNQLSYERTLLQHLANHPRDYANALRKLPRNLLKMFVHGYQSVLFNKYLAIRIESLGLGENEGDIIINDKITGPLYGYSMKLAGGKPGEIEKDILKSEGLELTDFKIKSLPEASSKGARRPIVSVVYNFNATNDSITFKLEKGCYATTVLDFIFGNKPFTGNGGSGP